MSIKIMTQVWESGPEDRGELLVLLALADFANDQGKCWPSVATIAQKARMTTRSVQRTTQKLVTSGWLVVEENAARNGCNRYTIVVKPRDAGVTPDTVSPQTQCHPRRLRHPPLTPASPHPRRPRHPNRQEPSVSRGASDGTCVGNDNGTAREKLLTAMGVENAGIAGPSNFLGTSIDLAEAKLWSEMGISLETQCRVIVDVCRRERAKDPSWMPKRFRYFTGAMRDSTQQGAHKPLKSETKTDRINFYRQMAAS